MFLDGMVSVLSSEDDFEILFVENDAKTTLNRIDKDIPDIVITDISMPEMNGIEFIKRLKQKLPSMKVLVVSMFQDLKSNEDIDGYLLKSTPVEQLIRVIKEIVLEHKKCFFIADDNAENFCFKKNILSLREKEIIKLIAKEYTTDEIAYELFLSKSTVETHRKNIFYKLQVKNIAGLVKKAIYLGVVE